MIDRNVEFPNRFRMTKVEGTDDIYDLIPAPGEVIAPGDTFSKANMLPDSIPAALGLKMANPQVKDALNVLAHVGNLHVWERVQTYAEEVPAGYTLGELQENVLVFTGNNNSQSVLYYADSISVDKYGMVSLVSPSSYAFYANSNFSPGYYAKGKFFYINPNAGSTAIDGIWFLPSDSNLNRDGAKYFAPTIQKVTGYAAIPAGTTTDYLTSTDRNAYTDGAVDNTTITYLGQLGGGARIEVGSYVGTGTYGSSNPNSLTFGFEPKAVLFWSPDNNQTIAYVNGGTTIFGFYQNYSDDRDSATCSLSGNTLSWYASDARCQGNVSGTTYYYTAIG